MPTPRNSPSRSEVTAERVAFVRKLFRESMSLGDIKKLFAKQFGCHPRVAERYYTLAKKELLAEIGLDVAEMRGMSAEFYFRIAGNPNLPDVIRMRARENLDRLFGLHAPIKTANTTTSGDDIPPVRTPQQDRDEFIKLVEATKSGK